MPDIPYTVITAQGITQFPLKVVLGRYLALNDNLEQPIPPEQTVHGSLMRRSVKLSSTMLIFFCLDGEMRIRQGATEITVRKNDVVFVRSGLLSEMLQCSPDLRHAVIIMDEKFYYPIFSGLDISELQNTLTTKVVCSLPEEVMQECVTLYRMLKERILTRRGCSLQSDVVRGYLQAITFIVYSRYVMRDEREQKKAKAQSRQQEIYSQFMAELKEHYTQERKIAWYADKICVTPRYLSRVIHDISGHFAGEHIDLFVIAEAKHMLRNGHYTILQVSEMLNFTSQSLFSRFFKKMTGYSPREFQQLDTAVAG